MSENDLIPGKEYYWDSEAGQFCLAEDMPAAERTPKARKLRKSHFGHGERFIGSIPVDWLVAVAKLPKSALLLALVLWYRHGLKAGSAVTAPSHLLAEFGLGDRSAYYRARDALVQAGLVRVDAAPGRSARYTLLPVPEQAPVADNVVEFRSRDEIGP